MQLSNFRRTPYKFTLPALAFCWSHNVPAESINIDVSDPVEKGLAIFQESDRRDEGFQNFTADLRMLLKNREGDMTRRNLRSKALETQDDGDKTLMVFDSPLDVKGTAFLTFSHKQGSDDQWIYLPALKRIKRVSSANKSGSFMGSEFTYEDLSSPEVEKYTYKYLRDEAYKKRKCFVVERYPVDKNSGYKRQIVWVDQQEFIPWKIDFYDRRNSLLKTMQQRKYHRYLKQYWRAGKLIMANHLTKKTSLLLWKNFKFRVALNKREFNPRALESVR